MKFFVQSWVVNKCYILITNAFFLKIDIAHKEALNVNKLTILKHESFYV
jgi:hypothetical protein